jgi:hypothetical protein
MENKKDWKRHYKCGPVSKRVNQAIKRGIYLYDKTVKTLSQE